MDVQIINCAPVHSAISCMRARRTRSTPRAPRTVQGAINDMCSLVQAGIRMPTNLEKLNWLSQGYVTHIVGSAETDKDC